MGNRKNLYVIRLRRAVLNERRFGRENPDRRWWKLCVYVGSTALDPRERFRQHLTGYKAAKYPRKYGQRLVPRLYEHLNPVRATEAEDREAALAESLRERGYAVWQR